MPLLRRRSLALDPSTLAKLYSNMDDDGATEPAKIPTSAGAGHRLGPKANTGAINAGLRVLGRTGAPCRKWDGKTLQLKSFTGVLWQLPSWRTPKPPKIDKNGEVMISLSDEFPIQEYSEGHISTDPIRKINGFRGSKEFHLNQATQHRLILSNIRNLRFNGKCSTNPVLHNTNLHNWRAIVKEMSVCTSCTPDRKHMHDIHKLHTDYPDVVCVLCDLAEMILRETGEPLNVVMSYANFTLQNTQLLTQGLPRLITPGVDAIPNTSLLGMGLLQGQGDPIGGQGHFHPSPAGLRNAILRADQWAETQGLRIGVIAIRFALESCDSCLSMLGALVGNISGFRREVSFRVQVGKSQHQMFGGKPEDAGLTTSDLSSFTPPYDGVDFEDSVTKSDKCLSTTEYCMVWIFFWFRSLYGY